MFVASPGTPGPPVVHSHAAAWSSSCTCAPRTQASAEGRRTPAAERRRRHVSPLSRPLSSLAAMQRKRRGGETGGWRSGGSDRRRDERAQAGGSDQRSARQAQAGGGGGRAADERERPKAEEEHRAVRPGGAVSDAASSVVVVCRQSLAGRRGRQGRNFLRPNLRFLSKMCFFARSFSRSVLVDETMALGCVGNNT